MIRRKRLGLVLAAASTMAAACTTLLVTAGADVPATQSAGSSAATMPAPAFAAMDYYDQSCAHCHGPQGSAYGPSIGKDLDDKGLIKVVRDMADGPAQAHLEESDVLAETAFHRALMLGTPYLSVTSMKGAEWAGEVMVDAKVMIAVGGKTIEAKVTDWNWTATLPENSSPADVAITASLAGKNTILHPAKSMYSSSEPLPAAKERPAPKKN
jgi:cytochrome c553